MLTSFVKKMAPLSHRNGNLTTRMVVIYSGDTTILDDTLLRRDNASTAHLSAPKSSPQLLSTLTKQVIRELA